MGKSTGDVPGMNLFTLLVFSGVGVLGPYLTSYKSEPLKDSNLLLLQDETINTLSRSGSVDESGHRFIIKLDHPIANTDIAAIQRTGIRIEGYLPHYAFLVSSSYSDVSALLNLGAISWCSAYEPRWKLAPSLIDRSAASDTLHLWLFDDADINTLRLRLESDFGARIYSIHNGRNKLLKISMDNQFLYELAAIDDIRWIEPFYSPEFFNDQAQWVLQSWKEDKRDLWSKGLDGSGVVASTGDAGITTSHTAFKDSTIEIATWGNFPNHRKIIAYQPSAPGANFGDDGTPYVQYHGTHTGCTVCGDDSYWNGDSPYDGMAKGAKLYFVDVGTNSGGIAYPADYNDMYELPWQGNQGGSAKLMSNSWGSGGSYNTYDLASRQTDEFMWNHPDFLVLYSAGNSSGSGISPPSTAKNVVSVGATLNGTSATIPAGFSSQGPTADGRIKPTITAPGYLMSADGASTSGYKSMEGTSMSSPAVAGITVLLAQYFREGWYPSGSNSLDAADGFDPSAALLKALLINSAVADFSSNPIPDMKVGWGRVCLDSVLYFEGNTKKLYVSDNVIGLETGDDALYKVEVSGKNWPLRATLVWSDFPGDMVSSKKLVNDLDIKAVSPSGKIYLGNVFSSGFSVTSGAKDETNVEECLRINNPELGTWEIHILAANIPQGPQPYALVINGVIENKEPHISAEGIRIDDSSNPQPNNALDPGETAILYPRIMNEGDEDVSNANALLSSPDTFVTILDSDADYGSISAGLTSEGQGFSVTLEPYAKKDDAMTFNLTVFQNGGSKIDTLVFHTIVGLSGINQPGTECPVTSIQCPAVAMEGSGFTLELTGNEKVVLELFDVTGRKIETLYNGKLDSGIHQFSIPSSCKAGVYFIKLDTPDIHRKVKVVVIGG